MASKMKLIPCDEPEGGLYPTELCPKCNRTMGSNGKGQWFCSNCGQWYKETDETGGE
jgi:tRNA(Ile2) C34 agmatinyltransferase TiaS